MRKALELGFSRGVPPRLDPVSCDPFEDLLSARPTRRRVLQKAGFSLKDLDVIEFHEA